MAKAGGIGLEDNSRRLMLGIASPAGPSQDAMAAWKKGRRLITLANILSTKILQILDYSHKTAGARRGSVA